MWCRCRRAAGRGAWRASYTLWRRRSATATSTRHCARTRRAWRSTRAGSRLLSSRRPSRATFLNGSWKFMPHRRHGRLRSKVYTRSDPSTHTPRRAEVILVLETVATNIEGGGARWRRTICSCVALLPNRHQNQGDQRNNTKNTQKVITLLFSLNCISFFLILYI